MATDGGVCTGHQGLQDLVGIGTQPGEALVLRATGPDAAVSLLARAQLA